MLLCYTVCYSYHSNNALLCPNDVDLLSRPSRCPARGRPGLCRRCAQCLWPGSAPKTQGDARTWGSVASLSHVCYVVYVGAAQVGDGDGQKGTEDRVAVIEESVAMDTHDTYYAIFAVQLSP